MMVDNITTVGVPLVGTLDSMYVQDSMGTYDETNTIDIYNKRVPTRGTPTKYTYNRRSIRLSDYDYTKAGYYFITIATQNREHLFGEIMDGVMGLNVAGEMVNGLWYTMKKNFPNIVLHEFVIMPNHIHGIIQITDYVGVPLVGTLDPMNTTTVGDVVGSFKSLSTNAYIKMVKNKTLPPFNKRIWQRNYYEHVIRDDADYTRIAQYVKNNQLTWEKDTLNT